MVNMSRMIISNVLAPRVLGVLYAYTVKCTPRKKNSQTLGLKIVGKLKPYSKYLDLFIGGQDELGTAETLFTV